MKPKPRLLPSGRIDVEGQHYRLREVGARFEIVHAEEPHNVLGSFEVEAGSIARVSPDSNSEVVRAIAEIYVTPRGILPIQ